MIVDIFVNTILATINFLTSWIPTIDVLPWGTDTTVGQMFGYFNYIAGYFPPLVTLMQVAFAFFAYKMTMFVLKTIRIINY